MSGLHVNAPAFVAWLRKATGYTQEDLALLCGMSATGGRVLVAEWERGTRTPNARQWRVLLNVGVPGLPSLSSFLDLS